MDTTALTGLKDFLCETLSTEDLQWLCKQLDKCVFERQLEQLPPPRPRYTMDEINAMLDEAERQAAAGESMTNEEFFRSWDELIAERHAAKGLK